MEVWAGGNVNGLQVLKTGSSSYTWVGGSCKTACQTHYTFSCGSGELIIGIEVWLGGSASTLNSIQILCGLPLCSGGTYYFQGLCYSCGPGLFSPAGSAVCNPCPAGQYSGSKSSTCILCSAGKFSQQGSASCALCSAGQYSLSGSISCTYCLSGSFSSSPGAASSIPLRDHLSF